MRSSLLLIGLTLASPAFAQIDFCGFGNLGDVSPEQAMSITAETYQKLWDSTLASKVDPETISKMIETGDPFVLPAQTEHDPDSFRQHLEKFKGMVEAKGWMSPTLNQNLIAELVRRRGGVAVAEVKQAAAVKANGAPKRLKVDSRAEFIPLAGEKEFLVYEPASFGGSHKLKKLDIETGALTTAEIPGQPLARPQISPAGDFLVHALVEGQLAVTPIENGQPNWKSTTAIGKKDKSAFTPFRQQALLPRANGKGAVVAMDESSFHYPVHFFDLDKGTRTKLNYRKYEHAADTISDWWQVGNTGKLLFLSVDSDSYRVNVVTVSEKGEVRLDPDSVQNRKFKRGDSQTLSQPVADGPLVAFTDRAIRVFPSGNIEPILVSQEHHDSVSVHPSAKWVAELKDGADVKNSKVAVYRTSDGREETSISLSGMRTKIEEIEFLPNGQLLLRGAGKGPVLILDVEGRLGAGIP